MSLKSYERPCQALARFDNTATFNGPSLALPGWQSLLAEIPYSVEVYEQSTLEAI